MRRLLAALLLGMLSVAHAAALARPWLDPDTVPCGCTNAVCCCAKRARPDHAACQGPKAGSPEASLRCHHPGRDLSLPSLIAILPPTMALGPARGEASGPPAAGQAPHPGHGRIDSPPPRPFLPVAS